MFKNNRTGNKLEIPDIGGQISFFILLVISVLFYKERIIFSDSAFQFFKLVNFETFNIEARRYAAIVPQIPVLLAMKAGFGLKWLTVLYSASFIGLYYLIFLITLRLFKNQAAALSIVLVLVVSVRQSFFHPVTETHQAMVYSILMYAILSYPWAKYKFLKAPLLVVSAALSFLSHPIGVFTMLFLIGFYLVKTRSFKEISPYILVGFILIMAFVKMKLTSEGSYEGSFISELRRPAEVLSSLHNAPSTVFFLSRGLSLYFLLNILQLVLITIYIWRKQYMLLAYQLVSVSFFLLITLITYHKGDAELMMERAFMPLSIFICVPLLTSIFSSNTPLRKPMLAFLLLVILLSFNRIIKQGNHYKERTAFNQEILHKTAHFANRKFIIPKAELDQIIPVFWSHSFETLLLSSIDKNVPTQTIYPSENKEDLDKYTQSANDYFLGANFWLEWRIEDLNTKFFILPKDQAYKIINLEKLKSLSY